MKPIIFFALCAQLAYAYHDPDLNYHLSQIQKVTNCDNGYSYDAPSVQLTTAGVKLAAPAAPLISQTIFKSPGYQYSSQTGYTTGVTYLSNAPNSAESRVSYKSLAFGKGFRRKEVHGYATSAGLSSAATRPIKPAATFAQAPIIAKQTGAPLIAQFAVLPAKTSYATRNSIQQQASYAGSLAKGPLDFDGTAQPGGPIVTQVYSAPETGYATADTLKLPQNPQYLSPLQYNTLAAPNYNQLAPAGPVVSQYYSPGVPQFARGQTLFQKSAQTVLQYSNQPVVTPLLTHAVLPGARISVNHVSAPNKITAAPKAVKNVHTDFVDNYDAHPRYAYEYSVSDPHTGDVKQQKEERDGETVKGQYSLVEPDGSIRTVNYVADWKTGFHADVQNSKNNHR